MSDVKTFKTPAALGSMHIRVETVDGKPWFVARDVLLALGFDVKRGTGPYLENVRPDEKGIGTFDTPGGRQKMTTLSESGLYKLILRAQRSNPIAAQFQDWVTREVLPSINKHGAYFAGQEGLRDGTMSREMLLAKALQAAMDIIAENTGKIAYLTAEVEQVTVDEYFALTHRYATRAAKCKLGATATALARQTGTTLERQFRALGRKQVHVNVYPRSLLERAEAKA